MAIEAVIFDMDGLILNTEKVYTIANSELLKRYGKEFTWSLKAKMMGQPARDAISLLIHETGIPVTIEEASKVLEEVEFDLFRKAEPLPGAMRLLQHLKSRNVPIAIATGSRRLTFDLKTGHLPELLACFPPGTTVTADDIPAGRGKPNPDVFLLAAERIKAAPEKCLVFEDGLPGIEAARRAKMTSIWVPDAELRAHRAKTQPEIAEDSLGQAEILESLVDFEPEKYGLPAYDM